MRRNYIYYITLSGELSQREATTKSMILADTIRAVSSDTIVRSVEQSNKLDTSYSSHSHRYFRIFTYL